MGLYPGGSVPVHDHSSANQGGALPRSVAIPSTDSAALKAWINYDSSGTPTVRASFNVSSITDNGSGDQDVNLTTALTDANWTVGACGIGSDFICVNTPASGQTSSKIKLRMFTDSGALTNPSTVMLVVAR